MHRQLFKLFCGYTDRPTVIDGISLSTVNINHSSCDWIHNHQNVGCCILKAISCPCYNSYLSNLLGPAQQCGWSQLALMITHIVQQRASRQQLADQHHVCRHAHSLDTHTAWVINWCHDSRLLQELLVVWRRSTLSYNLDCHLFLWTLQPKSLSHTIHTIFLSTTIPVHHIVYNVATSLTALSAQIGYVMLV